MSRARKLQLLALCALAATAGGVTLAAFSGQTTNSGNTFSAAGSFGGGLRMASGTYDGDGADDRSITGLGFQPDSVVSAGDADVMTTLPSLGSDERIGFVVSHVLEADDDTGSRPARRSSVSTT